MEAADPLVSGATADPDSDGRNNYSEFLLGSPPLLPDPTNAVENWLDTDAQLTLRFPRWKSSPGSLYIPQVTSELTARWHSGSNYLEEVNVSPRDAASDWVTVRDRTAMTLLTRRFIRLCLAMDRDQDGLPDDWEILNGLSPLDGFDAGGDLDSDGFTNADEFASGSDPLLNSSTPLPDHLPSAPANVQFTRDSEGGVVVTWEDTSDNESWFVIRDYREDGTVEELGRVGPGQTSIYIPPQR